MRSHLLLTGALSVGSLASMMGCSVSATPDGADHLAASEGTSSVDHRSTAATAVVVVERTTGPGDAVRPGARDTVIARFVRVRQGTVDDQALRIAGAAWDLPALGTCGSSQRSEPSLQPRTVDLLDVGVLTLGESQPQSQSQPQPQPQPIEPVQKAAKTTVLVPRTMPDPTGVVAGVFYSARSTEAFTPTSRLQLHTSGGPDLPEGFMVSVTSPRDLTDVRVTSVHGNLDVAWEASDPDDIVYVDVIGPSARVVARCTTADVGHLVIAGSSLGSVEEGQLSVHRLHRESFRTKGIEPGEIRFDLARVVTFRR